MLAPGRAPLKWPANNRVAPPLGSCWRASGGRGQERRPEKPVGRSAALSLNLLCSSAATGRALICGHQFSQYEASEVGKSHYVPPPGLQVRNHYFGAGS